MNYFVPALFLACVLVATPGRSQSSQMMPEPTSISMSASLVSSAMLVNSTTLSFTPESTSTTNTVLSQTSTLSSSPQSTTGFSLPILITTSTPTTSTMSTTSATVMMAPATSMLEGSNVADDEVTESSFLSEIKYIYIIVGIILFLILIIILLISVVAIMCQRRVFDRKQKRKKAKKGGSRQSLSRIEAHRAEQKLLPNHSPAMKSPVRSSPKRNKPLESITKNGVAGKKDDSPMSDFPLLCRVLQDYDTTQHKARQTSSASSNEATKSPVRRNATNNTPSQGKVNEQVSLSLINNEQESCKLTDDVFMPMPTKPICPVIPDQNKLRASSEGSISEFETSWGKSTTVSYVSGCRDSHDYDELESMIEHLKKKKAGSPPRSPPKIPMKIFGGVSVLPTPSATLIPSKRVMRNESMKRSQSANDIFDDPKYTRMSVGSSNSAHPMASIIPGDDIYDHLGGKCDTIMENKSPAKEPLTMRRSMSTSAAGGNRIERQDYKEYMSLQQLLDIMETKIPSREASEEKEDGEDKLYCPRVLRPVQV